MRPCIEQRSFASPDVAVRKLVEIANALEPVQDGRIYVESVNAPFLAVADRPVTASLWITGR